MSIADLTVFSSLDVKGKASGAETRNLIRGHQLSASVGGDAGARLHRHLGGDAISVPS